MRGYIATRSCRTWEPVNAGAVFPKRLCTCSALASTGIRHRSCDPFRARASRPAGRAALACKLCDSMRWGVPWSDYALGARLPTILGGMVLRGEWLEPTLSVCESSPRHHRLWWFTHTRPAQRAGIRYWQTRETAPLVRSHTRLCCWPYNGPDCTNSVFFDVVCPMCCPDALRWSRTYAGAARSAPWCWHHEAWGSCCPVARNRSRKATTAAGNRTPCRQMRVSSRSTWRSTTGSARRNPCCTSRVMA